MVKVKALAIWDKQTKHPPHASCDPTYALYELSAIVPKRTTVPLKDASYIDLWCETQDLLHDIVYPSQR
jgi:hypothetical protein